MIRFIKILFLNFLISIALMLPTYAATGNADLYKVTMRKLEFCTNSTGVNSCDNAVVVGSGDKEVDITSVSAGASAAAFAKYFPNSDIFCLDINISNFKYVSKNIEVFGVDVKNEEKVRSILEDIFKIKGFKGFDLIIDDGSHLLSDIIYSLNFFFKML